MLLILNIKLFKNKQFLFHDKNFNLITSKINNNVFNIKMITLFSSSILFLLKLTLTITLQIRLKCEGH